MPVKNNAVSWRKIRKFTSLVLVCQMLTGCFTGEKKIHYWNEKPVNPEYYQDKLSEISYPILDDEPTSETVSFSKAPRTLRDRMQEDHIWDMTLAEAIHLAIANNKIIRVNDLAATQTRILSGADFAPSIWDPAIQETGVLFGGRGTEAALSAFDTTFSTRMLWGRDEQLQNNQLFTLTGGRTTVIESANFISQLTKPLATGGSVQLSHNWDYAGANQSFNLFPSSYRGSVRADFRQPLLAAAGVEYSRIAGPPAQTIQGLTGVNQGVAIARINNDVTIADFENNVTNMLYDVERAYWDLYFAYRRYDTATVNRNSALRTWREVYEKYKVGSKGGGAANEAQAREAYYERRTAEETALGQLDALEVALRRLCGLPVNDGSIIRPADEPVTAEFTPDWHVSLAEALTRRVELRRQKWQIKSFDLQLRAARSLTKPRLDVVSSYAVNGFGDKLLAYDEGKTNTGMNSAYTTLTQGDQTSWGAGFEFSMPIGFRSALAQVRNYELRLAKARAVLTAQEEDISYQLANSFQDLALHWSTAENNFNRRRAAERQLQAFQAEYEAGTQTLDLLLQSQARLAAAENAYYSSIVEYTKTIAEINYMKGTLLDLNNVHLTEGPWTPEAYHEAYQRAFIRTNARDVDFLHHEPAAYGTTSVVGSAGFVADEEVFDPETEMETPVEVPPPLDSDVKESTDEAGLDYFDKPAAWGIRPRRL